jgi:hypothetical protein
MPDSPAPTVADQQKQTLSSRAGYVSPEEQAKRLRQDEQMSQGMNLLATAILERRQAEDNTVNQAATGGFRLDAAAIRSLLPQWQSIADKLRNLATRGEQFRLATQPAADEGSTLQIRAAMAHADAYQTSVRAQQLYAERYVDALKKSLAAFEQQDQATADAAGKPGPGH